MFQNLVTLPHETEEQALYKFDLWFRGVVAYDLETGAELFKSRGRVRSGYPKHFYVRAPDQRTEVKAIQEGYQRFPHLSQIFRLDAYSEQEAIRTANALFPTKYQVFQTKTELYRPDTPEEVLAQRGWVASDFAGRKQIIPSHLYTGHLVADLTQSYLVDLYTWCMCVRHSSADHLIAFVFVHDDGTKLIPRELKQ